MLYISILLQKDFGISRKKELLYLSLFSQIAARATDLIIVGCITYGARFSNRVILQQTDEKEEDT